MTADLCEICWNLLSKIPQKDPIQKYLSIFYDCGYYTNVLIYKYDIREKRNVRFLIINIFKIKSNVCILEIEFFLHFNKIHFSFLKY